MPHNIPDIWRQTKGRLNPQLSVDSNGRVTFGHDRRIDLGELTTEVKIRLGLIIPVSISRKKEVKSEVEQGD